MTGLPKDQVRKFREAARELGCDESDERFDDALRKIAKQKPGEAAPKGKRSPKSE
jgi:hypothetical protein